MFQVKAILMLRVAEERESTPMGFQIEPATG
jgi:hypothetical protein